ALASEEQRRELQVGVGVAGMSGNGVAEGLLGALRLSCGAPELTEADPQIDETGAQLQGFFELRDGFVVPAGVLVRLGGARVEVGELRSLEALQRASRAFGCAAARAQRRAELQGIVVTPQLVVGHR